MLVDVFVHRYMDQRIDLIAGLDARGFILGSVVAYELNIGFVPVRKGQTALHHGGGRIRAGIRQRHRRSAHDACQPGQRVVVLDDLVATGGTMMAGVKLLSRLGGEIVEAGAIVDLPELGGSQLIRQAGIPLFTCVTLPATERGGKQHKTKPARCLLTVPALFFRIVRPGAQVGRRFLRGPLAIGVGGLGGGDDRGRLRRICRRLGQARRRRQAPVQRQHPAAGHPAAGAAEPLAPRRQPTSDPASSSWAAQPVRRQVWPAKGSVKRLSTVGAQPPA